VNTQTQNYTSLLGPHLLVGTQEGHLLVYDVSNIETNDGSNYFFLVLLVFFFLLLLLLLYNEGKKGAHIPKMTFQGFGKRSLTQMSAIVEYGILISLLGVFDIS
jgi:hypothetical protein